MIFLPLFAILPVPYVRDIFNQLRNYGSTKIDLFEALHFVVYQTLMLGNICQPSLPSQTS